MAVNIGSAVLTEVTDNGNQVLEVSGAYCGLERLTTIGGRSGGDVPTSTYISWNNTNNNNHPSGGLSGSYYTAPYDGSYMCYVWLMSDNNTTHNNRNWRLRVNNSSDSVTNRQVYVYSSNGGGYHREWATGIVVNLNAGDFIRCFCSNIQMYAGSNLYTRFNVVYLG